MMMLATSCTVEEFLLDVQQFQDKNTYGESTWSFHQHIHPSRTHAFDVSINLELKAWNIDLLGHKINDLGQTGCLTGMIFSSQAGMFYFCDFK
jgi:hypothetical protein